MAADITNWLLEIGIEPKSTADQEKLSLALDDLVARDSSFRVHTDRESRQLLLRGLDELHLDNKIDMLRRDYGVGVSVGRAQVGYRETITRPGSHAYTHKKQAGGSPGFAVVEFDVAPHEAGGGNSFETSIEDGALPREYIAAVENAVESVFASGPLAGFPMIDVGVVLVDGGYNDRDSSTLAFEAAATAGLSHALKEASLVLKEPIMKVEVVTLEDYLGAVIGDLNTRRGQVIACDERDGAQVVEAMVPLANLFGYPRMLHSMTDGRATFTMHFDHYEVAPPDHDPRFRPAMAMRA